EAQLDRFMLKVKINYPNKAEELEIIERMTSGKKITLEKLGSPELIQEARALVSGIHLSDKIKRYVVDIVFATRQPKEYGLDSLAPLIAFGASPRASIYLTMAAKAHAFLRKRAYVMPEDVKAVAMDVLRHRLMLTYEAEAEEIAVEDVLRKILMGINVP
nr:ATPase [Cyanobacteria bacterium UBA8530]